MKLFKVFRSIVFIMGIAMLSWTSAWSDTENNDGCTQIEQISEMHNKTGGYSRTESGQVSDGDDDYYYFTVAETGTLSVTYSSNRNTDLWIQVGGTCLTSSTQYVNDGKSYTGSINVSANETVRVRIRDNSSNSSPTYDLALSYAPPPKADLSITKTVSNANPNVGDTITYTLTGKNNGTASSKIQITDTLPAALTYGSVTENSSNFSCSNIGNAITCNGTRDFNSGDTVTVTITATVNTGGLTTNTANIASFSGVSDPIATNNSASVSINTVLLAPIVTPSQSFTLPVGGDTGMLVGTVLTTGGKPTAFSILSGNTSNIFGIDSSGKITLLDNTIIGQIGTVYTLKIQASNASGSDDEDVVITVADAPVISGSYRPFSLREQLYAKGNMKTIGNTVLVAPTTTSDCTTYTNGLYATNSTAANGDTNLCAYSVDGTQVPATTSELALPVGAKVIWAGLYWQGQMKTAVDTGMVIKIRKDNGSYVDLRPNVLNYADSGYDYDGANGISYAAFTDVTYLFGEDKWNEGNYTVAGIPVIEGGKGSGLGAYGAWTLVAIYEDVTDKFRSFSVFDGWQRVTSSTDAVIDVSGFYTPNRTLDTTAAKVSVFAAEGDLPYTGDQLITKNYNTGASVALQTLTNNTFNSQVTGGGARTPNPINNFGIDIQSFDIGNLLQPKQTDMRFTFTSSQDVYWPSMIAFATELVAPQLCYDYSYKQDGRYLKTDNNGTELPVLSGYISSSPIDTSIYIRNNEADIIAQGVSLFSDVNESIFAYVPNSIETSNTNGSVLISRSDTSGTCSYTDTETSPLGCTTGADVRIGLGNNATGYTQFSAGTLGDQEFIYTKFSMEPIGVTGIQEINASMGYRLNYYIVPKTGAKAIPYTYELGRDIPLCSPTSAYEPTWGTFNVTESGATLLGSGLPVNNIRTQVSRNPFNVNVTGYGKNAAGEYSVKPTADMTTTVLVEIIDSGPYHDANATCANPDSALTPPIYVPISVSNAQPNQSIPLQAASFYNFAVENGAFRVWLFTDTNDTLIQNWTATTSDPSTRLNLTGISGLYQSTTHTVCATACATPTSVGCFECIKANYAKPLCSRDNFAVRPESYDIRMYDVDKALAKTDPVKDATKIGLTKLYGFSPDLSPTSSRMDVAAGYKYRFDVNATGHDGLNPVPGYTQEFNSHAEHNATVYRDWDVNLKTGCNDTSHKSLEWYIRNGVMVNTENNVSQVGEYNLNMIDKGWTEVDWRPAKTGHHLATKGFESDPIDCILNSTTTLKDGSERLGCDVSSAHIGGGLTYKDQALRFHPASFDITSTFMSVGSDFNVSIKNNDQSWTYMNTLRESPNMGVRYAGRITAKGDDNVTVNNFVSECYSQPVKFDTDIAFPTTLDLPNFTYRFQEINGSTIWRDTNATMIATTSNALVAAQSTDPSKQILVIPQTSFLKNKGGDVDFRMTLNFDRDPRVPVDPISVGLSDLNASCEFDANCSSSAYQKNPFAPSGAYVPSGTIDTNNTTTFLYGRLMTRDVRVFGQRPFDVNGWYEVFNLPTFNGVNLLPSRTGGNWFMNPWHEDSSHGDSNVTRLVSNGVPTVVNYSGEDVNSLEVFAFPAIAPTYNGRAHVDSEPWLWFGANANTYADPTNANLDCLTHPCINVTVLPDIAATGSAKTESEGNKGNKNSQQGGGWKSTSEYAPAVR